MTAAAIAACHPTTVLGVVLWSAVRGTRGVHREETAATPQVGAGRTRPRDRHAGTDRRRDHRIVGRCPGGRSVVTDPDCRLRDVARSPAVVLPDIVR